MWKCVIPVSSELVMSNLEYCVWLLAPQVKRTFRNGKGRYQRATGIARDTENMLKEMGEAVAFHSGAGGPKR